MASPKRKALLIVDMINTLDFPEGKDLLEYALPVAANIAKLKARFKKKKLPVIYVNDNFDLWTSDWKAVYQKCSSHKSLGRKLAETLKPDDDDYFVLKPKHSGFYLTPLEMLLDDLKVKEIVITGVAGNICVLFTAHEAHMREYKVIVPQDTMASNTKKANDFALEQLSKALGIPTTVSSRVRI